MADYKLNLNPNMVTRTRDGTAIMVGTEDANYRVYRDWLAAGGIPDPVNLDEIKEQLKSAIRIFGDNLKNGSFNYDGIMWPVSIDLLAEYNALGSAYTMGMTPEAGFAIPDVDGVLRTVAHANLEQLNLAAYTYLHEIDAKIQTLIAEVDAWDGVITFDIPSRYSLVATVPGVYDSLVPLEDPVPDTTGGGGGTGDVDGGEYV